MTRSVLFAGALALALAGCSATASGPNPALVAGTSVAVNATNRAAAQANKALDQICANYQAADAAFSLAAFFAGDRIPQSVIKAEADAVLFLAGICADRPADAAGALRAAQNAFGALTSIRDRFRA